MTKIIEVGRGMMPPDDDPSPELQRQMRSLLNEGTLTTVLEHITPLLARMDPTTRKQNIDERRLHIGDSPTKQLIDFLNSADQGKCNEHPTFYSAVIDELIGRRIIERPES